MSRNGGEKQPSKFPNFRAVALEPTFALGWNALGWTLVQLKHYDEGIAHLRRSATLDPSVKQVRLRLAEALKLFDIPFALTGGGPGIATQSYSFLAFRTGLRFFDLGYASAMAYGEGEQRKSTVAAALAAAAATSHACTSVASTNARASVSDALVSSPLSDSKPP